MTVTLRPSVDADRPALDALIFASKASWGYDDAFMARARADLRLKPAEIGELCRVAERDGRPAGVALLSIDPPAAEIEHLFIAPEAQGHGVGRALMRWCVDTAAAQGAKTLGVLSDPNAAPFYVRMGMAPAGTARAASTGRMLPRFALRLPAQG